MPPGLPGIEAHMERRIVPYTREMEASAMRMVQFHPVVDEPLKVDIRID